MLGKVKKKTCGTENKWKNRVFIGENWNCTESGLPDTL